MMAYEEEIKSLSSTMAENIERAGKKTIAVADFTDLQGNVTELGRFLAEEFSVKLAGSGKRFEVVDRTHLKSILREHKLSSTGLIDPQTARKLGKIIGVDTLITGTITPFGDSIRLSIKILDTATAKIIGGTTGNIAKTKAIEELLAKGVMTFAVPTPEATIPTPSPQIKSIAKEEFNDFIFELKGCKRSGQNVLCTVDITNTLNKRRDLRIWVQLAGDFTTFLYDDSGNKYAAYKIRFGDEEYQKYVEQTLPHNKPVTAKITFWDIPQKIKVVSLRLSCRYKKSFYPYFRNIPLTR